MCCKVCNSNKGTKVDADCHWPHLNNTYYSLIYDETGRVHVNGNMSELSRKKAQNLLDLIQLQRYPGTDKSPSPKDFRWKYRFEAWNKASRYKELYLKGAIAEDDVIDYAHCNGQWSIWFTVFKGIDSIRHRLITDFRVPVHIALMRTIIMNLLKGILTVRIQYDSIETANL